MKKISIIMILSIFWSFPAYSMEIDSDIILFAREKREELKKDTVEIGEFTEKSFWDRHKWKIAGAGASVIIIGASIFFTAGTTTPAAVGGAQALMGSASLVSATSVAGVTGGVVVSCLDEDGSLHIPEYLHDDVLKYYDDNYIDWLKEASSKENFTEIAAKNIITFIEKNKK